MHEFQNLAMMVTMNKIKGTHSEYPNDEEASVKLTETWMAEISLNILNHPIQTRFQ